MQLIAIKLISSLVTITTSHKEIQEASLLQRLYFAVSSFWFTVIFREPGRLARLFHLDKAELGFIVHYWTCRGMSSDGSHEGLVLSG